MPKCPGAECKIEWVWDNHMVDYRQVETGAFCPEKVILDERAQHEDGIVVTMYQCFCGIILGFFANDPKFGGPVFNHGDWGGVDWNDEKNN